MGLRHSPTLVEERKGKRLLFRWLGLEAAKIDRSCVEARRRARLEAGEREVQSAERGCQRRRWRLHLV